MAFVSFLGCDGSGKSAVIAAVAQRARDDGVEVFCGHWRPSVFRKSARGADSEAAEDPHGRAPRGYVGSLLKLVWLGMNWWCSWFLFARAQARRGLLLFDRYHADLAIDPVRYRYGGPMWLARLSARCMPQPDIVFYLDAPAEILLSRKREVDKAALEKSRAAYLRLARENPVIQVIDASMPIESVVREVMARLKIPG